MKNGGAVVAALVALQLYAAPVLAKHKSCGNNAIDRGEQCDGTADSGCPGMCSSTCKCPPEKTINIRSKASPANSPGTRGVTVTNPLLIKQFGRRFNLNKARYTRFQLDRSTVKPDAILILIPGFEGGAGNFRILAQNLLKRIHTDHGKRIEVWAFDRRTNQLEDTVGLDIAERQLDPMLAINWLFGEELYLQPDRRLPRRHHAVFYNPQDDIPFLANWTNLVFSQDIDAVVNAARRRAKNENVFLGGHSAGTAFTARYASTDLDITPSCDGTPEPGYAKLRGLVLLEGAGGSTGGAPLADDSLDRITAKADGGLFGAVRDNAPRCVDGTTPCTIASEATDCAGKIPPKCTLPTTSYALVKVGPLSLVNPRICAQAEPMAIQAVNDPNTGEGIVRTSGAEAAVPDLTALGAIPDGTVEAGFGTFLDKDSLTAAVAPFLAMSLGEPGPLVATTRSGVCTSGTCTVGNVGATCSTDTDCVSVCSSGTCTKGSNRMCSADTSCPSGVCTSGACTCSTDADCSQINLLTWKDILHGGSPPSSPVVFGPAPTTLSNPLPKWGEDKEVTRLDRVLWAFFAGKTNFTDWYYPNAGPSTTSVTGVCTSGTCTVGNVGATCSADADCSQSINLDSTQLSAPAPAGRGRCDIENLTQAHNINIPVIAFCGSQGLATVPGVYTAFGQTIATCSPDVAPSCDGTTARVVYPDSPNTAFPTFGGIPGGFEVYVNEGYSHLDVLTAEDVNNSENDNHVVGPLSDFIARNIQ